MTNISKREESLELRARYLKKNPNCFKGNTKARNEYIEQLQTLLPTLSDFQRDLLIGLILSDGSLVQNAKRTSTRMKIQLRAEKDGFLLYVKDCLLEYTGNDQGLNKPSDTRKMREFQTLLVPQLNPLVDLFSSNNTTDKAINPRLEQLLSPVSIAFWFCGDGSRADGGKGTGKGISFHTQCFKKDELEYLVAGLKRFNLKGTIKLDDVKKDQYRIDLSGDSYETFVRVVGPYIHPDFHYRVPSGRVEGSQFGEMTQELRDSLLGSAV